jgi:hypothetical protein
MSSELEDDVRFIRSWEDVSTPTTTLTKGEHMINKIKLDWYDQKQFLGEILSDLEYWNFEYEVTLYNGTLTIEIYGAGK